MAPDGGVVGCHECRLAMVGTAVGFDDAALLNFLANRWLETHTPLFDPCPHRYTLPTIKPSNLPSNSKVIIPTYRVISSLYDKPAFSPAARVNIRVILYLSPALVSLLLHNPHVGYHQPTLPS